ncbi:Rsm22-domain-containing protein [Pholiota conissans]|uniref:Rsm22-domain-containing protein n=1 Tax=Pholiota conissans TaxID=109636 RepID=A0A9P5ZFA8_9AGAR|nr:Rsm22-domain-containing protein [Pholiota conissans]
MFSRTSKVPSLRLGSCSTHSKFLSSFPKRSVSSRPSTHSNGALNLDPSYQRLLQDIDISLKKHKFQPLQPHRELEIIPKDTIPTARQINPEEWTSLDAASESLLHEEDDDKGHRKSPAALFGSNQKGTIIIPLELQTSINLLIADSDKSEIRSDAMRLFTIPGTSGESEGDWDTEYNEEYRSRRQAYRHSLKDGTAFATVALPAHYSAISSVLHHLQQRLGPEFQIDKVIDWGAATGSGLWASLYAFQKEMGPENQTALASNIKTYVGIDKREGLVAIGEKLVANTPTDGIDITWTKSFKPEHQVPVEDGPKTLALSAFLLTSLDTSVAQKIIIQQMWNSGADTIILIDHNTPRGFEAIAYAREYILSLGKAESEDPSKTTSATIGAHVVAPCPHDGACPLLHSGGAPLVCGFSQRLQRPGFIRRTKHSGVGHEDIGYSYVVIQRGIRPHAPISGLGRVGAIGKRALEKEQAAAVPMKELQLHTEGSEIVSTPEIEILSSVTDLVYPGNNLDHSELHAVLRKEAYQWPRLVFPPLKRSGHIILDSCTSKGKIMRLTIPKSQSKQVFYDARKSSWGDIFPHEPKIKPLERDQPKMRKRNKNIQATGGDIGKRKDMFKNKERPGYSKIVDNPRADKKLSKRDFARIRGTKVWLED